MNRWLKWALLTLAVVVLALALWRVMSARSAQQSAVAALARPSQTVIALGAADVVQVRRRELVQGLPIAGVIKAVNSASVRARVAGELQGLSVREGDAVTAGQIIARIDATEYQARVRQAEQQAQAARAQVDIAQRNLDNNQSLVTQGFISKTALDLSAANLAQAQASFRAAQAGAEIAAKSLADTVLRAPLSGLVAQRLVQPGERVGIDARIVEIIDLRRLELEASLSAGESLAVRVGQRALLQIEGTPEPVPARLVRINPNTTAGSRAVLVYLALDGAPGLRQGLFAQGTLESGRLQTLAIPLSAVRTDKPQPYVQSVSEHQVHHQNVELGVRGEVDGQTMVAVRGVPENTTLIAGTVGTLRAGSAVTVAPAAP